MCALYEWPCPCCHISMRFRTQPMRYNATRCTTTNTKYRWLTLFTTKWFRRTNINKAYAFQSRQCRQWYTVLHTATEIQVTFALEEFSSISHSLEYDVCTRGRAVLVYWQIMKMSWEVMDACKVYQYRVSRKCGRECVKHDRAIYFNYFHPSSNHWILQYPL